MWVPITVTLVVAVDLPWQLIRCILIVALLAASIGVIITSTLYVYMYLMQEWEAMKRRREIIEVFDSPPPTKRATTPKTRTSMREQRAGASRVRKHKRVYTKWFDPKRQGHCAYEAVLRAAGVRVDMDSIQALRMATAKMVELAVLNDENIAGIAVRDLVAKEGLTLAAYKAQVERDMWASPVEALVLPQ